VIDSIPGKAAGGYALAVDLGTGLARNGTVFDLRTGRVTGRVVGQGDASVYDPVTKRAFLLDDTVTAVDMTSGTVVARAAIAPSLESGVADGGTLYINREDSSIVTVVEAKTLAVAGRYPVSGCRHAQGMAMDRAHRRLFLGCDKELVVLNADDGAVVTRIPVSGHADENAFDPVTGLVFSANAVDSTVTVVREGSTDAFAVIDRVAIGGGARSLAVDEHTHRVYAYYYDRSATAADPKDGVLTVAVLAP
jgi:DNA-binding beta-propeller fold protein YncE